MRKAGKIGKTKLTRGLAASIGRAATPVGGFFGVQRIGRPTYLRFVPAAPRTESHLSTC
jgi:hypothetical protein